MRHLNFWIGLGVTALLFGGLTAAWANHHQTLRHVSVPQTRTATLLLPGDGGNWLSLRSMTLTLSQPHVATHSLTAHVSTAGRVHWTQLAPVTRNNPIIPILFADNTHPQRESAQLLTVLRELHQRYHISRVNLIGHSSGGTIALDYLGQPRQAPVTVTHLVCIGADFPGMVPLKRDYPQLKVLNLAGVIDDLPNDGEVPVSDARQLRPLVQGHVASYRLRLVHGHLWQTEHSLLHESGPVDWLIVQFIYPPS